MVPDQVVEWLKLAALIPGLLAAYKFPAGYRWMKNRITQALAGALMAQITPMLQDMQLSLGQVHHQVFPNGGGSLSDKLTKVLATTERTEHSLGLLRATMRAHQDADLTQARVEIRPDGSFAWASYALQRWTGRSPKQIEGFGWINLVAHADRERVRGEVLSALREGRELNCRFGVIDTNGGEFPVEAYAKPVHGDDDEPQHWVGVLTTACL